MLKKCIVIMVMFALVAGAAFAQVTFGGQLQTGVTLFEGTNVKDDDIMSGGMTYHEAKYSVLFGDATAGGRLVWRLNSGDLWGWMQWRPSQYFRIKIGHDRDGEWGSPQITGWGFTGEAKNSVAAVSDYNGSVAMNSGARAAQYGGIGDGQPNSLSLSFWPTDLLQINIANPNFGSAELSEAWAKFHAGVVYTIEEVGVIRFYFQGAGGLAKDDAGKDKKVGDLWLAFYSNSIVQGFAFEVLGKYPLSYDKGGVTTQETIEAGAGINLTGTDPFNLKLRAGAKFGGKAGDVEEDASWGIGILPSFKLPKMTIFFHAGLGMVLSEEIESNWFINPYVWVPMGGMRMWIGLQIEDAGKREADDAQQLKWKIPFGFNFYF